MNKIGKIGKINIEANKRLKWIYTDYGITTCELRFPGCQGNYMLSFAHKEKRENYRKRPEDLSNFKETLLACIHCHGILDDRSKTTEEKKNQIFEDKRG
jgi:hypothetical protein